MMLVLNTNDYKDIKNNYINQQANDLHNIIQEINSIKRIPINPKKKSKKIYIPQKLRSSLIDFFSKYRLKLLLKLHPIQQRKIIYFINKNIPQIHHKKNYINKILRYIFIQNGYEKLDKQTFYEKLGIQTCIYCNRNYIFNLKENGHIKGYLDHFYPKSKYPYLALNFYNLIPVCETCNKIKNEYDPYEYNILNPYEKKDEKIFKINFENINTLKIQIDDDFLKSLHIDKIYNKGHSDIIEELYTKFWREETKEHFESLKKSLQGLNINDDEIYRYLTCGYPNENEFHKRSFSKLISDVLKEFKEIL